ncbi:unnamed protein product [Owenia fusiformis]|uniref:Membrane-associated guanylate kinase, WW and PDZ domain-containing protein 1 n=1 Tax=Owenia fusiformis TaxID=6347 RepID=A0A8S4NQP7_OWEFU|nr:unnamed protein product [Owenia fusiformis]
MHKSKQQKPSPSSGQKDMKHWTSKLHESIVSTSRDGLLNIVIKGGADNGQYCYIGDIKQDKINYHNGKLLPDEIMLEVQGQKLAGYTLRDALLWLKQVSQNGAPVHIKTVKPQGFLTRDLRTYLNTRFQKSSVDHDLQQTIRDNLYTRTVPCTTRTPRPGEINGVDYTFLTTEEFMALEKSGNLLESGLYDGNHYGTPKPPKEPVSTQVQRASSTSVLPGAHPSSEGKRKRNRSNIEATQAAQSPPYTEANEDTPTPRKKSLERSPSLSSLGPLPPNWEMSYTDDGTPYFIDHTTEVTHWLDPRIAAKRKRLEDCEDNELPYGWEKVEDPHYGTYYIDHVNRKTQYENPVLKAKGIRAASVSSDQQMSPKAADSNDSGNSTLPRTNKRQEQSNNNMPKRSSSESKVNGTSTASTKKPMPFFTKNPAELKGEYLVANLTKSVRGFGFTIIGGEERDDEFLQCKTVVPDGPADINGIIKQGDILVHINEKCVLGFTHQDVVSLFQSIPANERVSIEVCRGYNLPFDPDDPDTEIRTTVAVTLPQTTNSTQSPPAYSSRDQNQKKIISNSTLPDVAANVPNSNNMQLKNSENEASSKFTDATDGNSSDLLQNDDSTIPDVLSLFPSSSKPELLSVGIVKGVMGFGFTIADSAYGQKVKQILDKDRCKTLQEGDILVEINHIKVKDSNHSEVVQVLKNCTRDKEALVTVQRGGMLTPNKGRKTPVIKPPVSPAQSNNLGPTMSNSPAETPTHSTPPDISNRERSKTPTNEQTSGKRPNDTQDKQETGKPQVVNKEPPAVAAKPIQPAGPIKLTRTKTPTEPRAKTPTVEPQRKPEPLRAKTPTTEFNGDIRSKTPTRDMQVPPQTNVVSRAPFTDMQNQNNIAQQSIRGYRSQEKNSNVNHTGNQLPRRAESYSNYYDPGVNTRRELPPPQRSVDRGDFIRHKAGEFYEENRPLVNHGRPRSAYDLRDRWEYGQDEPSDQQRQMHRSRTPGPEMMQRDRKPPPDNYYNRPKTPTAQDMRKERYSSTSGTPDFIPASMLQSPTSKQQNYHDPYSENPALPARNYEKDIYVDTRGPTNRVSRPVSAAPDFNPYMDNRNTSSSQASPNTQNRLNSSSSSYASHNSYQNYQNYAPYGNHVGGGDPGGRVPPHGQFSPPGGYQGKPHPRKQSTSFEHSEPTPSNLTRVPRHDRWQHNQPGMTNSVSAHTLPHNRSPNMAKPPVRRAMSEEEKYLEMTVFLQRTESGFGFRIIGGKEEGSQVAVGHIVPGGASDIDGRIQQGDEILFIDGCNVIGSSHHKVVELMGNASLAGRVSLGIRRKMGPDSPHRVPPMQHETYPYDVTVTRRENEGFGFVIISSVTKAGTTVGESIGRIIENSPAERCGKLHIGDRILAVNGVEIMRMHHEDIVNLIKDSGYACTLTVGPPQDDTSSTTSTSQRSSQGSMMNATAFPAMSESDSWMSGHSQSPYQSPTDRRHQQQIIERHKALARQRITSPKMSPGSDNSDNEYYSVELHRGSRGFGFSIRGGEEFSGMPLYVLRIAEGGAADLDRRLLVGDQLLEVNGFSTNNMTHAQAINLIQRGGPTVRLFMKRTNQPPPPPASKYDSQDSPGGLRPPTMTVPMPNGPLSHSSPNMHRRGPENQNNYMLYNQSQSRLQHNY